MSKMTFFQKYWPPSNEFLGPKWRAASAVRRDAFYKDWHDQFWSIADDEREKSFGGEVYFFRKELPFERRLRLFELAFQKAIAGLNDPKNDVSLREFGQKIGRFFDQECLLFWLENLPPPQFLDVFRKTKDVERTQIERFLSDLFDHLRMGGFSAFLDGKKYWIIEGSTTAEDRQELFSEALRQLFQQLDGGFEGRTTMETLFRKILGRRCIDFYRKKTTAKSRNDVPEIESIELVRAPLFSPSFEADLEKSVDSFEKAGLRNAVRQLRKDRFPCFFLVVSNVIYHIKAAEIFADLARFDSVDSVGWQELPLFLPISETEIATFRGRWQTQRTVETTLSNCLNVLRNLFFQHENPEK